MMEIQIAEERGRAASEMAARDREYIRKGVTKEALKALKARFGYMYPAFIYPTNGYGVTASPVNPELIKLHAAVRDGQREVISYIEQILNSDDV